MIFIIFTFLPFYFFTFISYLCIQYEGICNFRGQG